MPRPSWPDDRVNELLGLLSLKMTSGQISKRMGITRSSVTGQIHRMKQNDHDRLMAAGYGAMSARGFDGGTFRREQTATLMDELAEHLSNELSVARAAVEMGISATRAGTLFTRICMGLGRQAV